MNESWSDEAIVKGCKDSEPLAQKALYDKYVQAMYNTAYRYTMNHQDTQDVLQNAFEKVFRYIHKFDIEKGTLLSWMRKINIRCALDFLKKQKVYFDDIQEMDIKNVTYSLAYEEMEAAYILALINDLDPVHRAIFNLHQIEGYSHEEISQMLSINTNSSRVYLARVKQTLREKITLIHNPIKLA
jgi:RNA polymerase sigma factor (sigma-70 family)